MHYYKKKTMSVEYLPSPRPGNLNQCIGTFSYINRFYNLPIVNGFLEIYTF